uniref:Uncharacterized protein n=1 Tax=Noctiluca scintillans TaxID=2966 RepID=A0A7S1AK63_NOCSC|mmetsp:Transcript_47980/g.127089  ORF Transcript_47980/g.127089 Transcript_47980/m.127089 type:complete len:257 (+) Transcript_47980:186-956(+)|eukprot:CAMPEP_0194504172 /NCGR_PEP_ID=MMETSP0253-20130528/28795_1 /TAXON_ID=2966 /ORGANISM="Noctiluca scintillans" /LENGTH=256 /DNA_ID=CAMNT_0039346539 /DNA_START=186 /DNA_END=956 /DNA_ORIENTATION=+
MNFSILNDEKKILRRQVKEVERQKKIEARLQEVKEPAQVGNWADASDDEDEDAIIFRPVSDSESEKSDSDEDSPRNGSEAVRPDAASTVPKEAKSSERTAPSGQGKELEKPVAKPAPKKKEKKQNVPKEEEDLDGLFAEFNISVETETDTVSKKKKKKDKEREKEGEAKEEKPKVTAGADTLVAKGADAPVDDGALEDDDLPMDEASRQAALDALRKKQAGKGKKSTSDAQKHAAAEAKKRAANKKVVRDKSAYDR